jgi:glycosyltransferase involved in cell wall biosynthesis
VSKPISTNIHIGLKIGGRPFLIVGDGTEYGKLVSYVEEARPQNIRLLNKLPKEEYDRMIASCDVGMIFLDHRFTIPNFPSRLLSYMQAGLPVLACTDLNTDIGQIITEGGFGWWCESNNPDRFADFVNEICSMNNEQYNQLKNKSIQFLYEHYSIDKCYEIIMSGSR